VPTGKGLSDKAPIYGMDWLDDRLTDDITPCGAPNTLAGSPAFEELAGRKWFEEEVNVRCLQIFFTYISFYAISFVFKVLSCHQLLLTS
jgi:hypothetical protein